MNPQDAIVNGDQQGAITGRNEPCKTKILENPSMRLAGESTSSVELLIQDVLLSSAGENITHPLAQARDDEKLTAQVASMQNQCTLDAGALPGMQSLETQTAPNRSKK